MKKRLIPVVCLLAALMLTFTACFTVHIDIPVPVAGTPAGNTPAVTSGTQANTDTPAFTLPSETQAAEPASTSPSVPASETPATTPSTPAVTEPAPAAKNPAEMTGEELLQFFNSSLNRIKTDKVGFKKHKLTSVLDLELSNSAANAVVGLVKSSLLSETGDETVVPKGGDAVGVFSPSGKPYISQLRSDDLTSIRCDKNGDVYVITLTVKGETNPGEGSIMSRGFDYMTVDDVVNIYAPKVGATVDRNDVEVVFSDCKATLTVTADGVVTAYQTYVKGVMKMNNAQIKKVITISTDLNVTLASTTDYSAFQY
ncbi:MAG: hypothetical protein IK104_06850 [Clostridia bacterium]|nr:hypothetical protein [Clostridia bacterium]MBR5410373.1 hypothetical protein [Clostridia bacterium]